MTERTLRILRSDPTWSAVLALCLAFEATHARDRFYIGMTSDEIRWFGGRA